MNYSTIPTVVGAAKLRNASLLGQKVDITRVAFGDGDGAEYEPTGQETTLKKQVYECPPNRIEEEAGAPTWIELEAVIPHNAGGWYLREVACFDDEGDLIFIGNLPSSFKPSGESGVIKDLVFEMVYDAVAADVVQIKIDPNVVIATRKYVDDKDKEHVGDSNPHPQYIQINTQKRQTLFMPVFCAGAGWTPDPDLYAPELGQKCYQSEYPTVYDIVSTQLTNVIDEDTKAASIADGSNTYSGYFGLGSDENGNYFTTRNKSLFMHDKAAGVYGSVGEFKDAQTEDHAHITGFAADSSGLKQSVGRLPEKLLMPDGDIVNNFLSNVELNEGDDRKILISGDGSANGILVQHVNEPIEEVIITGSHLRKNLLASIMNDKTDSMGAFSDAYICLPKGEF